MRAPVWILAVAVAVGGAAVYLLGRDEAGPEPEPLVEEPASPLPAAVHEPAAPPPPQEEQQDFDWALKALLDADGNVAAARKTLLRIVDRLRTQGRDPLAHIAELRAAVYRARPFPQPRLTKRDIPKNGDFHEIGTTTVSVVVPDGPFRFTLAMPKSYVPPVDPRVLVDTPPTPLIVTLHEMEDYVGPKGVKRFPGEEVLKRRFDPAGPSKAVIRKWAVLAPVATQGKWVGDDGIPLMREAVAPAMREAWTRYHLDFDRFVIDGGSDALQIAASRPHLFAGVIVRGDEADVEPEIVLNFAHLHVYVVGSEASAAAKTLAANGFPAKRVTVGGPEGLADWLKTVKRAVPKSFHFVMKDREMSTANWVAINAAEDGPGIVPVLDVEVADTAEEPNTVKIRSTAVLGIALLLNDDIVDLDREVRVIVNGQAVMTAQVPAGSAYREIKLPMKFERSLDTAFLAPPLKIRTSLFYGMLFPVLVDGIEVWSDDGAPADAAEAQAKRFFEKAESFEKKGYFDAARKLYRRIVEKSAATTFKDRAEAKLKELEANGSTEK